MQPALPLVSIIIATYNRSNVLFYTIRSVINSSYTNWELLVVGDACTDDTEQVVRAFNDARIKFYNLDKNYGEQSAANNKGIDLAKGEFVVFLNHDDLWFPDHLSIALAHLQETAADIIYSVVAILDKITNEFSELSSSAGMQYYSPLVTVPISAVVMRKDALSNVGRWRYYKECYASPSQDLLVRAWKMKLKIHLVPKLTVLMIQSGKRVNSYKERQYKEHEYYAEKMLTEMDFREQIITQVALKYVYHYKWPTLFSWISSKVKLLLFLMGMHPEKIIFAIKYRQKGGFITKLRKIRGLN